MLQIGGVVAGVRVFVFPDFFNIEDLVHLEPIGVVHMRKVLVVLGE